MSFEQIAEPIRQRKIEIDNLMGAMSKKDAQDKAGGFWSYLSGNHSGKGKPKDLSLYPNLDINKAETLLTNLRNTQKPENKNSPLVQKYFNSLNKGQEWQIDFVNNNDLQKASAKDLIAANDAARNSAIKYNNGLKQMTLGAKATAVAIKTLAVAGNMLAFAFIFRGIELAATAIDNYIHRVEKSNEAMETAASEYQSAKSELEHLNSELDSNKQKMDELLSKGNLTYAEQGQLEELQKITKELETQQDIAEKTEKRSAKESAEKTVEAYEDQYGDEDISKDAVKKDLDFLETTGHVSTKVEEDDITGNIAQLLKYQKLLDEANKKLANSQNLDNYQTEDLKQDLQFSVDRIETLNDALNASLSDLSTKQENLKPGYEDAIEKQKNGEFLTTPDKDAISTYESIADAMKLIYEYTDPAAFNSISLSSIFDMDGMEKTKEELIQMAASGDLTPDTIEKYKNINNAAENSELILQDDQTAAAALCDEIYACAEASAALEDSMPDTELPFTDSLSQVQNLSQGLDQLTKIYSDIRDKGAFDWSSILDNTAFQETFSNMGKSYEEFIETVRKSPEDIEACQSAFDNLATSYIDNSGALDDLSEETKGATIAMLEQQCVANAEEFVEARLAELKAKSAAEEAFLAEQKNNTAITSSNLQNASWQEISALLATGNASAVAAGYLTNLALSKLDIANHPINSNSDIDNIIAIANAAGASEDYVNSLRIALVNLQNAQANVKAAENIQLKKPGTDSTVSGGLGKGLAIGQAKIQEQYWNNVVGNSLNTLKTGATSASLNPEDFHTNSSGSGVTPGSGGSSNTPTPQEVTETAETFDFMETLISRLSSAFDKLKSKGENAFLSLKTRVNAYSESLTSVNEQISTLTSASASYMAKANSFGLEEEWAIQVRDGSLNIAEIKDDGLKERIKNYQTWYDKAVKCNDEIEELRKTQTELSQAKIEVLITKYDQLANKASSANTRIENSISLKEGYGGYASANDYKNLNKYNRDQIKYANAQIDKYKELQKTVKKGSEQWYDYQEKIDSNCESVQKLTQSILENAQSLAGLEKKKAEAKIEKYDASDELLDAKSKNTASYKTQNKYVNEEIRNINRRQTTYHAAVKNDNANITSARNSINRTKATRANKSLLKQIKSYTKSRKEIPTSLLSAAAKLNDNNTLYQKCVQYNAYLAAYDTDKAAADLYKQQGAQDKADLAIEKQSNIAKSYENRQSIHEQKATEINSAMDLAAAKGYQTSEKYYKKLQTNEQNRNISLVEERQKLIASLTASVKNGSIKRGSDEWYELRQQIDEVTNSINDSNLSLAEYKKNMRQIKWDNFDYLQNRIRNVTSELDFMINELSREDLVSDKTGKLTDNGNAVAALHVSNYTAYSQQAKDYKSQIDQINKELAADPYNQELLNRRQELVGSYQESISAAQEEKYAIIDLYTQGYDALQNKIGDLISEYESLLDAEKDAYDYQNTIADKTKEIGNIRKMLAAYSGDVSEEARTKVQSLTVSLADAEKDLKETQYDKYISNSKEMLADLQDDLAQNIQEIIHSMSKNFDKLIADIGTTSSASSKTITNKMQGLGYAPSSEFLSMLNGSNIVTSTAEMITNTKNFQEKMTTHADTIANALKTSNVTNEVNKNIQNDGAKSLSTDVKKATDKKTLDKLKFTQDDARQKMNKAKANSDDIRDIYSRHKKSTEGQWKEYQAIVAKYGKNSKQAKHALEQYKGMKSDLDEMYQHYQNQLNVYQKSQKKYNAEKAAYDKANLKSKAMSFLQRSLDAATVPRKDLSDINKAFYDQYGQRMLSNTEILELANILGIKFDNQKTTGTLYKKLKEIGINGFKIGSRSVPKDQLALLAEEGTELHLDKDQGILRPVGTGDKIFTNTDTENLWNWAKTNPIQFAYGLNRSSTLPSFVPSTGNQDVTIDLGGIVMNGVNDVETFGRQVREELCKNGKTTKCIVEAVSSEMLGKGIGNARLYR